MFTRGQCVDISQVDLEHNPDSVSSLDLFVMNGHLGSAALLVLGQEKECFYRWSFFSNAPRFHKGRFETSCITRAS